MRLALYTGRCLIYRSKALFAGIALTLIAWMPLGCAHPSLSQAPLTLKTKALNYYQDVQGKSGAELMAALAKLIAKHKDLGYDQARDLMFAQVDDPQDQDLVECVYTGRQESGINNRATANQKKLNTEHSWPQSKGAKGSAKSDLHHLFPTDADTNSRRSSLPFGEIKGLPLEFAEFARGGFGVDTRGRQIYEPRDIHKGNVARALLYFYVCYGGQKLDLSNFRQERDVLLRWHESDPVDANEIRRNNVVQSLQGNRNPFIDHPEYVKQIGEFPI